MDQHKGKNLGKLASLVHKSGGFTDVYMGENGEK